MAEDAQGPGYVYKMTKYYTNSYYIWLRLNNQCRNKILGAESHRHVTLLFNRADRARIDAEKGMIFDRLFECFWWALGVVLGPWTLQNECFAKARRSFSKINVFLA